LFIPGHQSEVISTGILTLVVVAAGCIVHRRQTRKMSSSVLARNN